MKIMGVFWYFKKIALLIPPIRRRYDNIMNDVKHMYEVHKGLEEEINFLKFRNDELGLLHDEVVERHWRKDESRKRFICVHPFERIEILPRGEVYTCCSAHLKHDYYIGNIFEQEFDEIWNSEKAMKLRYSVSYGNFEYCNRYCKWLHVNNCLNSEEDGGAVGESTPIRERGTYDMAMKANSYEDCKLNVFPKYISLSCDFSCNLTCETCRNQINVLSKDESDKLYNVLMNKVRPALINCETLDALGSGEFFASKAISDFFKSLDISEFPKLKLFIITNAQLFTKERWDEYKNLHQFPMRISISVDGASKETYEKIRRGAKWEVLCENIKFIKTLKNLQFLSLNFVIQKDNWRQIEDFVKFAISNGADAVEFQKINNWGTFDEDDFFERDVLNPENQYYADCKEFLEKTISGYSGEINFIQNIM